MKNENKFPSHKIPTDTPSDNGNLGMLYVVQEVFAHVQKAIACNIGKATKKHKKNNFSEIFESYAYDSYHFAHFVVGFEEEGVKNGKITV